MWKKRQALFCSKPFEWFEVTQLGGRGGVYLCCPSWLDIPVGNLRSQTVEELWNGRTARNVRQSILDGSFRYCDLKTCAYYQTVSGPVQRRADVSEPAMKEVIDRKLLTLPYGPRKVICTYDQSCNLSCPTCRTGIIQETGSAREILSIQGKLQEQALGEAELLYITGSGDPFGSPFFRQWLRTMSREAMPRLRDICLHTNGLLWTEGMWETLPRDVREIVTNAEISIDAATAPVYAVNRRGGDFETLMENLAFIGRLRREGPLEYVKISMVVQENNFRSMPDFVRLGKHFGVDSVYFGQLLNWGTFSDQEFKARAVHLPTHPRHRELATLLGDPVLQDPIVQLGNLSTVARQGAGQRLARWLNRQLSMPRPR